MHFSSSKRILLTLFILCFSLPTWAQGQDIYNNPAELKKLIIDKDNQFWQAYNQCKVSEMVSFLSEDLEFYHDKNGFTQGKEAMEKSLSRGLCANGPQLRREVIEGSVQVYPLKGIGAIISGEHAFFVGDQADSKAKFTHVWRLENDQWLMSRVLSYDHQLPPFGEGPTAISIDDSLLQLYAGNYQAPQTGKVTFTKQEGGLNMVAGEMQLMLLPENDNTFFHKPSGLSFQFVTNEARQVTKVVIHERGKVVEEAEKTS